MKKITCKSFRYKGKRIILLEDELGSLSGFRLKKYGTMVIFINKNLSGNNRSLEFHRFITGRGLRNIKFQKRKIELDMQGL
ncbi:hypothetical protein ACJDU8_18935 [Clostridium sp. WILCCON 0269]|uniref:Uncharacterized protein n=1 Tax=Candidatus Clostridium eludens TaxID=3381663 RepID=A0ABW8SNZ2_9CLOT